MVNRGVQSQTSKRTLATRLRHNDWLSTRGGRGLIPLAQTTRGGPGSGIIFNFNMIYNNNINIFHSVDD